MANPYADFLNLIPKENKWIGKIVSISSDGDVVVSIPGAGGTVVVKGDGTDTYAVDDHVYIKGDTIQGKTADVQPVITVTVI